jgi:hypothetical protein
MIPVVSGVVVGAVAVVGVAGVAGISSAALAVARSNNRSNSTGKGITSVLFFSVTSTTVWSSLSCRAPGVAAMATHAEHAAIRRSATGPASTCDCSCADAETDQRGALRTLGNPITRATRTSLQHLRGGVRLLCPVPSHAGPLYNDDGVASTKPV